MGGTLGQAAGKKEVIDLLDSKENVENEGNHNSVKRRGSNNSEGEENFKTYIKSDIVIEDIAETAELDQAQPPQYQKKEE